MCGRYGRRGDKQRIAEWMQAHNTDVFDELDETNLAPSFNVAPQSFQPVVRLNGETGERELTIMRWGLVPYWSKDGRLSSRQLPDFTTGTIEVAKRSKEKIQANWRYVVGTFQVKIPVTVPKLLLPVEENTYSILSWRFENMAPSNRWDPVFKRYLGYIAGRIQGLGGDPGTILPSPTGVPQGSGGDPEHQHVQEFTGKVTQVAYDRFGDFEGFCLIDEHGHEHAFHSVEAQVEELVRFAWMKRVLIRVETHPHDPLRPARILLLRDAWRRRD